jgi:FkbM family methyltransferase
MSQLRSSIQSVLVSAYKTANRFGVFELPLAERLFRRGYFTYKYLVEDPFAKLVHGRAELFQGGDVIDVGANIGYTATLFARAITSPYRVHAFEPEARNFRWLGRAIQQAKLGARVVAHHAAVGAHEGTLELWLNTGHHGDHRIATDHLRSSLAEPTERVPVTTIDAHVARCGWPAVAFVKIDVQGFEPEVLRGMHETIARNRRLHVAVELMPAGLAALGFDAADFLRDVIRALPRTAILQRDGRLQRASFDAIMAAAEHGRAGYVDLLCTAGG